MKSQITLSLMTACLVLSACSHSAHPANRDRQYTTARPEPHHDSDQARKVAAEGLQLLNDGKLEEAEQTLRRALEADVMFGPAHNSLGMVYYRQKRYYLAAWEFEYASRLMPDRPEPRNNFGLVFEAVGKIDDAVDWYGKAMQLAPDNPQIIGNLARAKVRRGDRDDQVRELLQQLVLKDTRPSWTAWAQREQTLLGHCLTPQTMPSTTPD